MRKKNDYCLVLSGGGARGAYQAGAIRALYEMCVEVDNLTPFRNLVGVSAGAINATYLASAVDDLDVATRRLCTMWSHLTTESVFATDALTLSRTALRILRALSVGGVFGKMRPTQPALLNVEPLRDLLKTHIDFEAIERHVKSDLLHALCVTATDYSTSVGVTFFMGDESIKEWRRIHRVGLRSSIGIDHVMGSASIPLFFPPWPIGNRYYGDGVLRNTAPLSPARRIGASKVIVIGVRKVQDEPLVDANIIKPTLGRVLSVVINAIFMDAVEVDIERVNIINQNLKMAAASESFREMNILHLQPSHAPSELAEKRLSALPPVLRYLISALGSAHESAEILSYLTFDPIYLNSLVELGYSDLIAQRENILAFLTE